MEDVNGKNKVEKKKILNELIKVFWVFIIGSIIGYNFTKRSFCIKTRFAYWTFYTGIWNRTS